MRDLRLWPDVLRAPVLTLVTGYESVAMVNMAPMLAQYTTEEVDLTQTEAGVVIHLLCSGL